MAGPAVVRFTARLTRSVNAKNGSGTQLNVPEAAARKLQGVTTVEGTINRHPFRAPLEQNSSGGFRVRVNKAMREGAGADVGDTVKLAVLGPEPEPAVPADLRRAFTAYPEARALWKDLNSDARRIWIRWIESAKKPETRARRVTRTVEQLAEGKRRPCCVNVYDFMQRRIQD